MSLSTKLPTSAVGQAATPLIPSALRIAGHLRRAPATSTHHQPHSTSSVVTAAAASSTPEVWPDSLPDLPPAAVWAIAGGLSFLLVGAVCLLMINFYPRHPRREQVKTKRGYTQVAQGNMELGSCCASRTSISPDLQKFRPQEARAGSPDTDYRAPTLRRRRPANLSIDTTVQYTGLGTALPGKKIGRLHSPPPPVRRSSSEDAASSSSGSSTSNSTSGNLPVPLETWTPLPSPLLAPAVGDVHSRRTKPRSKKSDRHRFSAILELVETSRPRSKSGSTHLCGRATIEHSRSPRFLSLETHSQHISDLEAGIVTGNSGNNMHWSQRADSPALTPYATPVESPPLSRTSSTLNFLLQTADDAIDYTTRKLAKMVYDQVNKDDPEEGLLLPTTAGRDSGEREGPGSV